MIHAKSLFFPGLCGDGDSATCIFSSRYPREQTAVFGKEQRLPLPGRTASRALPRSCWAGVPGSGGCEKSPTPHSLPLSGQVRAVTGTGDAPASSREGSPSSQLIPRTSRGCSIQRAACLALGRGTAAMVSWGNRSVTVGRVAAGMETETQGFRLGVCLSKNGRSWVSALPRPNALDVVTQLCLLPAPRVASCALPPAMEGRQSRLLPGLLRCPLHVEQGRKLYIIQ